MASLSETYLADLSSAFGVLLELLNSIKEGGEHITAPDPFYVIKDPLPHRW